LSAGESSSGARLSVVICTHDPRREYLERVLAALQQQSLPRQSWDLTVVDNASSPPVAAFIDLSWHPGSRLVEEAELGITFARLRGIRESRADVMVFVDDDNVLAPDYLAQALEIATRWPTLGAWGSSIIEPEFEKEPPDALRPYLGWLALRSQTRPGWSNNPKDHGCIPWGAGMCVRRVVAAAFVDGCAANPLWRVLGRRGKNYLIAGEDDLLALSSSHVGMGWGIFPTLKLHHLISSSRLTHEYIYRMAEERAISNALLKFLFNPDHPRPRIQPLRLGYHNVRLLLRGPAVKRGVLNAQARGTRRVAEIIRRHTEIRQST
jgi:glycosyltransferase involved in cell wall biosynthesis